MNTTKQLKAKGRDFPHLQNAVVDLNRLRFAGRRILHGILASHPGQKCLVLDPSLADPLNLITCGPAIFKAGGVRKLKLLAWERFDPNINLNTIIFIARPKADLVKQIAHQIRSVLSQGLSRGKTFAVYFVPCPNFICTQILREWHVYEDLATIGAMDIDLIPIDEDVLSLELDTSFKDCYLVDDTSVLVDVAKSIMKLQKLYGCISVLHAKGSRANTVLELLMKHKAKADAAGQSIGNGRLPQIDTCLVIDRDVDLITPMLSPLTYEALIDEFMGINQGTLKVDAEVIEGYGDDVGNREPFLRLSANDKLFGDIRNANIVSVGRILQQKSIRVGEMEAMKPDERTSSVQDIQDFLLKVPDLYELKESLQYHIAITERIRKITDSADFRQRWQLERAIVEGNDDRDAIFQKILEKEDLREVLRLGCLKSAVCNGFREKDYNRLRTEITRTYGWEALLTLHNLERLQLLKKKGNEISSFISSLGGGTGGSNTGHSGAGSGASGSGAGGGADEVNWGNVNFSKLSERFNLLNPEVSSDDPNDVAYVTSGFAPLIARLAERAMNGKWANDPSFGLVPGAPPRTERQGLPEGISQADYDAGVDEHGITRRKTMLVYVIGGITFMEIAALRFLSAQVDAEFDIIIATTKLVNGKNFVGGMEGHAYPVPSKIKPPQGRAGESVLDEHELPDRDSPFSPSMKSAEQFRLEQQQANRRLDDISAKQERQRQMEFQREAQEAAQRMQEQQRQQHGTTSGTSGGSSAAQENPFGDDDALASDAEGDEDDGKGYSSPEDQDVSMDVGRPATDDANPFDDESTQDGDGEGGAAAGAGEGDESNPFGDETATEDGTEDGEPTSRGTAGAEAGADAQADNSDYDLDDSAGDDSPGGGTSEGDSSNPFGDDDDDDDDGDDSASTRSGTESSNPFDDEDDDDDNSGGDTSSGSPSSNPFDEWH